MSAFIVSTDHIDALLTAGLYRRPNHYSQLRWMAPEEVNPGDFERGEIQGPEMHESWERRRRELTEETADAVGSLLLAENIRSVNHRYDEGTDEAPALYAFRALRGFPDPVITLKAIDCYEYQSSEHQGWLASEAHAVCVALREDAIHRLQGYDEAPGWSVTDRDIFAHGLRTTRPAART